MKACTLCSEMKPLTEFHKHPRMPDGFHCWCRKCKNRAERIRALGDPERVKEIAKRSRQKHRAVILARKREYNKTRRNRARDIARNIFKRALAAGDIIRPDDCSLCGSEEKVVQGHHEDYSKPLDVRWLCQPCRQRGHFPIRQSDLDYMKAKGIGLKD